MEKPKFEKNPNDVFYPRIIFESESSTGKKNYIIKIS